MGDRRWARGEGRGAKGVISFCLPTSLTADTVRQVSSDFYSTNCIYLTNSNSLYIKSLLSGKVRKFAL
jgi:hypothetical protein